MTIEEKYERLKKAFIILFGLFLVVLIAGIIFFRLWRNERQTSTEFESRLTALQRNDTRLSQQIEELQDAQASRDRIAQVKADSSQTVRTRLKSKVSSQRKEMPSNALTVTLDSLVSNLEETNLSQSQAFAVKAKTFIEVIRLQREKIDNRDSVIVSVNQENRQLKRDVKRQRFRKNVWKALFGIGFVGAAYIATQ